MPTVNCNFTTVKLENKSKILKSERNSSCNLFFSGLVRILQYVWGKGDLFPIEL